MKWQKKSSIILYITEIICIAFRGIPLSGTSPGTREVIHNRRKVKKLNSNRPASPRLEGSFAIMTMKQDKLSRGGSSFD